MKTKSFILLLVAFSTALIFFDGCKKKEQPAAPPKTTTMEGMMHQTATTAEEANQTAQTAMSSTEQTVCPVTGDKIDKNMFVEYKGKKVYFCCAACKSVFNKNPEKYIAKLPQFAK
jgi:YHS domain-containing protein